MRKKYMLTLDTRMHADFRQYFSGRSVVYSTKYDSYVNEFSLFFH